MIQSIQIRDALSDDAAVLAGIHLEARATAMPWLPKLHSDQETIAWMTNEVISRQRVRIAMADGAAVGFAAFALDWLEQLYVQPTQQSRGIGTALFNDICAQAQKSFYFWVFQRNIAARTFYERRGCHVVQLTSGEDNEEREPDALYEKIITRYH